MAVANHRKREISCKIVYQGPGLAGRTTNIRWIFDSAAPKKRGGLKYAPMEVVRVLSSEVLPDSPAIQGYQLVLHLETIPGAVFHAADRNRILKDADGVVFVADSQAERLDADIESLWNLENSLRALGCDLLKMPYVLQLNKRDLPSAMRVDDLLQELRRRNEPVIEAVAHKGVGVFETLNAVVKQLADILNTRDINGDLRLFPPQSETDRSERGSFKELFKRLWR